MEVEQRLDGDVAFLSLAREFDATALPHFSQTVTDVIDAGFQRIVLNMREIAFVSSSALGYVITAARHLREDGGALAISAPRPWLARNLDTLGLGSLVPVFADDDAAAAWLRREA